MSEQQPHYRGLVVARKRLRSQWIAEAGKFFPDAMIDKLDKQQIEKGGLEKLAERAVEEDRPMIAVIHPEVAVSCIGALLEFYGPMGDDLVLDEAVFLKNVSSERTKTLWNLRQVFRRAVALTGTPIDTNIDNLGALVAWSRNDQQMFSGQRLSKRFDPQDQESVKALWDALGPTVFRRDRSEIADELPQIMTETLLIDPEPAEAALINGAEHYLRDMLDKLAERLEDAAELEPDDPSYMELREEIKTLRGAALGGTRLALMGGDPTAIAASDSAGAALLHAEGLVAPALATGGTKRQHVTGLVKELVDYGESVLVFSQFTTLTDNLVKDMKAAGLRVGTINGKMTAKASDDAQAGFQGGPGGEIGDDVRYDVLVLTDAAKEGLNLQRASVLINYTLPWKPSDLIQRIGRASRLGSTADTLQVLNPVLAGTIEQRVAARLVKRGAEALAVLDRPRGVDTSQTETALALGGLTDAAYESDKAGTTKDTKDTHAEGESMLDFARDLLDSNTDDN